MESTDLVFRVSQTLFSSQDVDVGTRFLLRTLHSTGRRFAKVLDLGCGYGPIGLSLKSLNPNAVLHMVDRDALAIEYAMQNALLNDFQDISPYPSLAFDDVSERNFDLIVANVPGKIGKPVIASWLRLASLFLKRQGQVGVVIVAPLESFVSEVVNKIPGVHVELLRRRAGHTVLLYTVDQAQKQSCLPRKSFDQGDYDRVKSVFSYGSIKYSMTTVFGLPQFDSLSSRTLLLFNVLDKLIRKSSVCKLLVLNPGQGHIPVFLSKLVQSATIDMTDRDLLALRCSERNLILNEFSRTGISINHQVDSRLDGSHYELIVMDVRDNEGWDVIATQFRQLLMNLGHKGVLVVSANSTTITRLVTLCRADRLAMIKERKKRHGNSILVVSNTL